MTRFGTMCLAVALFAVGVASAQDVTDQYKREQKPRVWSADQVMEQRVRVVKGLGVDGGCIGCTTGVGTCSWDFPSLDNNALGLPCSESAECAFSGAAIGQGCEASSNLGADGGAALLSTANLTCRATAAGGVFKLCVQFTDAGVYNLHDAGFTARTFQ